MKKRVLSALLVLCMACSMVSTVWANQATPETATPETAATASPAPSPTPDVSAYPARTVEQTIEDAGVTVKVDVPAGSLPADAQLTAELIGSSADDAADQAVTDVAEELTAANVDYDGFVALDISFVGADGAKIEPLQPVSVSFSLPADLLPAEADPATLAVQHLAEDETGEVETVETVADVADVTDGTVTVESGAAALSLEEDAAALPADAEVKAEFEVDGFSTFTITWNANNAHSRKFTITCYDADTGRQLSTNLSPEDLILGTGNEFVFNAENTKLELANYEVESARIQVDNGGTQDLYSIKATYDWDQRNYTYTYKTSANGSGQTFSGGQNVTISVYYKRVSEEATGNLSIDGSNIADTGAITATYSDTLPKGAYYKWYRQLADGTWQQVSGQVGDSLEIYRDGARVTYKVELWQLNGTQAVDESAPFQVPYYNQLQNGSFEDTPVSGSNLQFTNGLYPEMVWQTTGLGALNSQKHADGQDIEIVNASALQDDSNNPYGVTEAREGNQLAELNCEYAGALYQDVLTAPGVDLTWWASHRARNLNYDNHDAEDTMYVVIMDAEVAAQHVTTQDQIDQIVQDAQQEGLREGKDGETADSITINRDYGEEPVPVTVWKITSGINETKEWVEGDWWPWGDDGHYEYTENNGGWYDYTDTYKVPKGQYLTRFFFAAGDTSTGDRTVGNLLDRVGFSQYPPTPDNKGAIAITKTVTGVDVDATIAKGAYSFTVNGQTVSLPTRNAVPTDTSAWTTTVNLTPGTYTVTETDPDLVVSEDYQYSGTFSNYNGSVTSGLTSSEILVTNGNTSSVTFNNTYAPTTTDVTITKTFVGLEEDEANQVWDALGFTVASNGSTLTPAINKANDVTASGNTFTATATIKGLTIGQAYTITETDAELDGYTLSTTAQVNGVGNSETAAIKELAQGTSVSFTNTYEPATSSLTITKLVDGDNDNAGKFDITVTGPTELANQTLKDSAGKDVAFNANATATVTLGDGESITIMGLPRGETYTVQEAESSQGDIDLDDEKTAKKDYYLAETKYQIDSEAATQEKVEVVLTNDKKVTITNTYKPYKTLTVEKIVTGEMGSSSDYFDFSATKLDEDSASQVDVTLVGEEAASDPTNYDFKLKSGGTVTIVNLKEGDEVTISEAADDNRGYTAQEPTLTGLSAGVEAERQSNISVKVTVPGGDGTDLGKVTFNNHREAVAPTGLESNHTTPYVLMITAAGMAGLVLIGGIVARRIRRRRRQE